MKEYGCFNVHIVISPTRRFTLEQQVMDAESLKAYFTERKISFIYNDPHHQHEYYDVKKILNPDILFYPQPYEGLLNRKHDYSHFTDRLLCYYPYAFWSSREEWGYNLPFHNLAWKLYNATSINLRDAQRMADNHGRNVVVVGYPNTDDYLSRIPHDVWKTQSARKKRVIIAPHCTISGKADNKSIHGGFLWYGEFVQQLALKYSDKIQFAFKPHPRLKTELYHHPDWGKEKTDAYYKMWNEMENGQLEEGPFVDLFMTSDALIHDSASFTIEYQYARKPSMFLSKDISPYRTTINDLGNAALDVHYFGTCVEDIIAFIDKVILDGNDTMATVRKDFFNSYLLPPNGNTVTKNTLDDILKSLGRK
jgi:hypothetical protein